MRSATHARTRKLSNSTRLGKSLTKKVVLQGLTAPRSLLKKRLWKKKISEGEKIEANICLPVLSLPSFLTHHIFTPTPSLSPPVPHYCSFCRRTIGESVVSAVVVAAAVVALTKKSE